jgi:beta-phosphoglucomutase-like phosphatase (HAD superfamily)
VLDREQLTACFSAIVAAEDTPASKPAPDPYLRAVALLAARIGGDLTAREVVAIEDSFWGLESARRAGLHTVGVAQTYPATALEAADLVIASVGDISLESLQKLCRE